MIRLWLLIAVFLAPLPAMALSCLAPSVERSFQQFNAAEETYVVVHGRLTLDKAQLPRNDFETQRPPPMTRVPARLIGRSLGLEGFKTPFEREVTLEVACFGPWCGSAQNGGDVLAFLRKDTDGYALGITPCGGGAFWAPSSKMLRTVKQCLRGGDCTVD